MSLSCLQSTDLQAFRDIGAEYGQVSGILLGLILFGLAYNAFVAWMQSRGYDEGYMSLLVAAGVLVTLAGMALIDPESAAIALVCFICSGLPMMIGSIIRYIRRRAAMQKTITHEIK